MDDIPAAQAVHVSMAVDGGYEMPLAVALLSVAESHSAAGVPCDVSVLCSGLDPAACASIERDVAGRVGIDWVEVDLDQLADVHFNEVLSKATLFRILLPELLPARRTHTIYLDADTVVLRPLTGLWQTDLGDALVGAVRDAGVPFPAGPFGTDWRDMRMPPDGAYFNAGVLKVPLDRWRDERVAEQALTALRRAPLRWGDQDALNVVAQGRWQEVPRRWNVQTDDAQERSLSWALWRDDVEAAVSDPAVVHYTGTAKPWAGGADHPFGAEWFDTLSRTSWAGWQPARPSTAVRAGRRLRRAANVLIHG
jgi:lipopolysaccharide biosynthesis glycosyltransferase